jgi:general secretion pathway protein G
LRTRIESPASDRRDSGRLAAARGDNSDARKKIATSHRTVTFPAGADCYAWAGSNNRKSRRMSTRLHRDEHGFTLLELLVVIAILGLLIGLVAPAALRQLGNARVSVARQSIERIGSVLDMYKLDVGGYPSSDQGLRALVEQPTGVTTWNGPYVKGNVPVDPWNRPYVYRDPSSRAGHDFDLCSEGPSGSGGGDEICNQ